VVFLAELKGKGKEIKVLYPYFPQVKKVSRFKESIYPGTYALDRSLELVAGVRINEGDHLNPPRRVAPFP
jgi:hypothetical protein